MNVFAKIIDGIIEKNPPEANKVLECQVVLKTGQGLTGQLRKTDFNGVYSLTALGARAQGEPPSFSLETFFDVENVSAIGIAQPIDRGGLIVPPGGNGRVIPGPGSPRP